MLYYRDVTVDVECVRSGLYCIKTYWKVPQRTTFSSNDGFSFSEIPPLRPNYNFHSQTNATQTSTEQKLAEYNVEFTIEKQPCTYTLRVIFEKSKTNIVASLTLTRAMRKPATKELNGMNTNCATEKKCDTEVELQPQPSAVWANLSWSKKLVQTLKKSWISDHWISDKFDGRFSSDLVFSSVASDWKPLNCLLWIEFEIYSGGEKNTLRDLVKLFNQQHHCDVQFTFDDSQSIGAHISILSTRSPVFSAMFQHQMQETKTGQVHIEDVNLDVFKELLYYIYCGRTSKPLNEVTAQPLFVAADKYDIEDLRKECVDSLLTCIRIDNVIRFLVWAHLHSVDVLEKSALTFIASHGNEVCLLKDWEELTKNYPDLCLLATRRIIEHMTHALSLKETK